MYDFCESHHFHIEYKNLTFIDLMTKEQEDSHSKQEIKMQDFLSN
jgi:hypothetical protein